MFRSFEKPHNKHPSLKKVLALSLVLMFVVALVPAFGASFSSFPDTADVDPIHREAMDLVVTLGLIEGMDDGTLNPKGSVTRAQFATILFRALTGSTEIGPNSPWARHNTFPDVAASHWGIGAITWAAELGIIRGTQAGTFEPSRGVQFREAVAMFMRAMQIPLDEANWAASVNNRVLQFGLNQRMMNVAPTQELTREQVAQLFDNVFFIPALPAGANSMPNMMRLAVVSGELVANRYASVLRTGVVEAAGWSLIANPRVSGIGGTGTGIGRWQGIEQNVQLARTNIGRSGLPGANTQWVETPAARIPTNSSIWYIGMDVTAIVRMAHNIWQVGMAANVEEVLDIRPTRDVNRINFVNNARAAGAAFDAANTAPLRFNNYAPLWQHGTAATPTVAGTTGGWANPATPAGLGTELYATVANNMRAQRAGDFTMFVGNMATPGYDYAFQVTRVFGRATVTPNNTHMQSAGTGNMIPMGDFGGLTDAGISVPRNGDAIITFRLMSRSSFNYYVMLPSIAQGSIIGSTAGTLVDSTNTWTEVAGSMPTATVTIGGATSNIGLSQIMNAGAQGLGNTAASGNVASPIPQWTFPPASAIPVVAATDFDVVNNDVVITTESANSLLFRNTMFATDVFNLTSATRVVDLFIDTLPAWANSDINFTTAANRRIVDVGINRDAGQYFVLSYAWTNIIPFNFNTSGWFALSSGATGPKEIASMTIGGNTWRPGDASFNLDNFNFGLLGIMYRAHNADTVNANTGNYVFGTYSEDANGRLNLNVMYTSNAHAGRQGRNNVTIATTPATVIGATPGIFNIANIANNSTVVSRRVEVATYTDTGTTPNVSAGTAGSAIGATNIPANVMLTANTSQFIRHGLNFNDWTHSVSGIVSPATGNAWINGSHDAPSAVEDTAHGHMGLVIADTVLALVIPKAAASSSGTGMVVSRTVIHDGNGWAGQFTAIQPNGEYITLTLPTGLVKDRGAVPATAAGTRVATLPQNPLQTAAAFPLPAAGADLTGRGFHLTNRLLSFDVNALMIDVGDFVTWNEGATGVVSHLYLATINGEVNFDTAGGAGAWAWNDANGNNLYRAGFLLEVHPNNQIHLVNRGLTQNAYLNLPDTTRIIWIDNTATGGHARITNSLITEGTLRQIRDFNNVAGRLPATLGQTQVVLYKANANAGPYTLFAFVNPRTFMGHPGLRP